MGARSRQRKAETTRHRPVHAGMRPLFVAGASMAIVSLFVLRGLQEEPGVEHTQTSLFAKPSGALKAALRPDAPPFEAALVEEILNRGYLSVTAHVALMDRNRPGAARSFNDGNDPHSNMFFGALFGMETHFANAAGWRRVLTDADGDGRHIMRRVVFHRRAAVTPSWQARGITEGFDVYVLANAWPSSRIVEAMEQPLRDALCGEPVTLQVDDREVQFGGGSMLVGYVGQNHMLEEYWDPFAQLSGCTAMRQVGVFYACPRSAVVLHQATIDRGLYSVLFTRAAATPEAYLVDGMLKGLLSGELGDAFVTYAAGEYARYQKSVSPNLARSMLMR